MLISNRYLGEYDPNKRGRSNLRRIEKGVFCGSIQYLQVIVLFPSEQIE